MKKLLTFFAMMVCMLCAPLHSWAWAIGSGFQPYIVGNSFTNESGSSIDSWSYNAPNRIQTKWDASKQYCSALIKATGSEAHLGFVMDNNAVVGPNTTITPTANDQWTGPFYSDIYNGNNQLTLTGLTAGKVYEVRIKDSGNPDVSVVTCELPTITAINLFDNSSGGSGTSKASLTRSNGTFSTSFTFLNADNKSWDNYYFFEVKYSNNTTKYAYIYSSESNYYNNIDKNTTITSSTNPALHIESSKHSNRCKGFGINGGGEQVITVSLNSDASEITGIAFTDAAAASFTLNATTAPRLCGWNNGDWGGGWAGEGLEFTKVGDSPLTYQLTFTANDDAAYAAFKDSNGNWYYTSDNESNLALGSTASTWVAGRGSETRTALTDLTPGTDYNVTLTQTADGAILALIEAVSRAAAPAISVSTDADGKGVFTISANLKDGETLKYKVDNGAEQTATGNRVSFTVDATSTVTAWVVDASDVKGIEASATWTNPADVTNPVVSIEVYDNSNNAAGAMKARLANTSGTTWSGKNKFLNANGSFWNNYYFLQLTYKDGTVRYGYLGEANQLTNIDMNQTYTTATTPALVTTATKHPAGAKRGFGVNDSNDRNLILTVTLSADHQDVTSLIVTEPESIDAVPVHDWSLEDDAVWGDATKKYFYISWNQNDNRVSPEWELLPDGDGNYVIENFMVIPNGQFRIREIERNGNGNGSHKVTDYGWNNGNYTIGASQIGLNDTDVAVTGSKSGNATMVPNMARGFRWNVGFSMASLKFNPTTLRLDFSIDFDQPSTLKQASKPGIPFVALMGSNVKVPLGEDQPVNFALTLNDDVENTAYTNAWVQYDGDGKLYCYGDLGNNASIYKVGTDGDVASDGTPARGQAMNSTRVPPVNLINFAQDLPDGSTAKFTSKGITFEYLGVVSDTEGTFNGVPVTVDPDIAKTNGIPHTKQGTRYAAYSIESVNLEGLFKIFSGYGAHTYGKAVNGLSFFANWGVGEMPSNDVYANMDAIDGQFVALAGGGAKVDVLGATGRGADGKDSGGPNDTYEDNNAGMYINFPTRSYVWKATFYYALEPDQLDITASGQDHHPVNNCNDSYTNTGRDYSWVHFNFSDAPAEIELSLEGADRGKPTWSINKENKHEATIHNYTVRVYPVDNHGNYVTDPSAAPKNIENDRQKNQWPSDNTTYYELVSGTMTDDVAFVTPTSSITKDKLPVGRYIAVMTYELTQNGETITRVLPSNIVTVFTVDAEPAINAEQQISGDEYTFDVIARANVNALYDAYRQAANEAGHTVAKPSEFMAVMTVPHVAAQGDIMIENGTGWKTLAEYKADHPTFSYTDGTLNFGKNTFSEGDEELYFPRVRVNHYIPSGTYDFTITIKKESGFNLADDKSATATVQIKAPKMMFDGEPVLTNDAGIDNAAKGTFNYVMVENGTFSFADNAHLADATAEAFSANKIFSIDGDGTSHLLSDDLAANTATVSLLPYKADADGMVAEQLYDFQTRTYFTRKADGANNKENPSEPVASQLKLAATSLAAPRDGIKDKEPALKEAFEKAGFTGFKTDGDNTADDYVTIVDNYRESYGGANRIIEDAFIGAELTAPTYGVVAHMPMDKQSVRHHTASKFHPDSHHKGDAANGPHEKAPGLKATEASHLTDAANNYAWWCVNPTTNLHAEDWKDRYYRDFKGEATVADNELPAQPIEFWAGCPDEVWQDNSSERYIEHADGSFDRIDPMNGLYDVRNHHTRAAFQGGEMIGANWMLYMFGAKKSADGSIETLITDESGLNPVFDSATDANAYIQSIKEVIDPYSGNNLADAELLKGYDNNNAADELFFNKNMKKPYALYRVGHVNHESWWASAFKASVTEKWHNANGLGEVSFQNIVDKMIKYPTKYYHPVAYDFSYVYPFLNNYNFVRLQAAENVEMEMELGVKKANVTHETSEVDTATDVSPVTTRSTGLISFDQTFKPANDIVTGIDNVGTDLNAAAALTISYDSATGIATVTAPSAVEAIEVFDIAGKQYGAAVTINGTTATADLTNLGVGVYTLRAVTADAAKAVKVRK